MNVLIVDDDDTVRAMMADALRDEGYEIDEAKDAAEAITLLSRDPDRYAKVITDVRMPGWQDGIDLAEYINDRVPNVEVIVTSGYFEHHNEAVERQATFLPKPWRVSDLVQAVRAEKPAGRIGM